MECKNYPLLRVKHWSELTEEEQQTIRDSWTHTVSPEDFYYFMEDLKYCNSDIKLKFRGNLCIRGSLSCYSCSIEGSKSMAI